MIAPLRIKTILISRTKEGRDSRFLRTLRFLAAKGYVSTALPPTARYRQKLSTNDLLWSCENVEPKLYQVVPAALLRFEGHFEPFENWSPELQQMIKILKMNPDANVNWQGLPESIVRDWRKFPARDRRFRKSLSKSKSISVRLKANTVQELDSYCAERSIDRTEAIHRAIEKLKEN